MVSQNVGRNWVTKRAHTAWGIWKLSVLSLQVLCKSRTIPQFYFYMSVEHTCIFLTPWNVSLVRNLSCFTTGSPRVGCSVVSDSLWLHEQEPTRLLCPWDSPSKNTGVGSQPFPSPGDVPDLGSNSGLLNCRQIIYLLSHQDPLNSP